MTIASVVLLGSAPSASAQSGRSTDRAPQPASPIDWNALGDETVHVLSDYLKLNTTNPPGNEMRAIQFLKRILEREGFEVQVLDTAELGATRGNIYARLKGNGSKKAIALVNHLDVVPATPEFWSVPPFSGAIKDGYVWGRGALDMKGDGIVQLMAMIALKRSGVPLDRDIVFIGNTDEELGSTGAEVFVKNHPDLLKDVEFLLTEGGENLVHDGKLEYYGIGIAEKRTFWQHVTVKGTPSHGSRPTKENPVPKLVAALDKIAHYETPLHVTPGVEKYFHDIARNYQGEQRAWLTNIRAGIQDPRARAWILDNVYWNAILRNTISLTVIGGSNKTNVIPPEATADVDIRLLPDQDPAAMLATLKRIVNDTSVHFTPLLAPKTPLENPIDTELFHAIERAARERDPGALVTTPMLTGATDRPTYRALGIITYGFDPFRVEAADAQRGVHGNNERVSVENVKFGVHYLYDVLRYAQ
ncbi:MAG TPA: M20/M25/M40 family metallo-hydrolase [Gemmatimonadaceae bacterium]|nr:M20/M25/M40 family metallo-hydrolase [Gemmatimonadaceae bacterium]